MQNATTLLGIIQERGKQGLALEDLYRKLFNPELYLLAYAKLYPNKGAMTRGITKETVDGMSQAKIEKLIEDIRYERFHWTPVRRVHIPKTNGKTRPLGIPTWTDKLLQEVMRMLLEAYYEPQFSDNSHGFRPKRGCHSALNEVSKIWTGTKWFIEGDIAKYFDNINHKVLLEKLALHIKDNRFLRLIQGLLEAGYLEDWKYGKTLSGTPQGSIISPLLANIYLDGLDQFVEKELIPTYTRGGSRRPRYREYDRLVALSNIHKKQGNLEKAKALREQYLKMPSYVEDSPDYRRLRYVRYADDFLLGFIGPKSEAQEIKRKIAEYLNGNLHLELSSEKTLITHATTEAAHFLGYEVTNQMSETKQTNGRRSVNGRIALRVPLEVLTNKRRKYMIGDEVVPNTNIIRDSDFEIISRFQYEYRGVVQYYKLAQNIRWLAKLQWTIRTAMLRTLAAKHKMSLLQVVKKYQTSVTIPEGTYKVFQVVVEREGKAPLIARFGAIPLVREIKTVLTDNEPIWFASHTELVDRLLADKCEMCGSTNKIEVHHIRKLADVNKKGKKEKTVWDKIMVSRNRKTLVLCDVCHHKVHAGKV